MKSEISKKKILLTGGGGFLGKHVLKSLIGHGIKPELITIPRSKEYNLMDFETCLKLAQGKDIIIHLAALVGGIGFNRKHPGQAFYNNASMALNMLEAFRQAGGEKFVGIGSACSYPKILSAPFTEDQLWSGYPEETNASYGLAKKLMLVQSQSYRQEYGINAIHLLMVNLYGPEDSFHPEHSHVIPALIKKVIEAKKRGQAYIDVWGTGNATREFLYVQDAAKAIVLATEKYNSVEPVNIGSGQEVSIKDLVKTICRLIDYRGEIRWNIDKPDGQPRRLLDVTRAAKEFGFRAGTTLEYGLKKTIDWYQNVTK